MVPLSSHSVTPAFSVSPADTNAVLSPSVARRTDWPTGQAVIAAWIAAVSSVSSLGCPAVTVLVASTVAHAAGIVGSAPMASHGGRRHRREHRGPCRRFHLARPARRARAAAGAAPGDGPPRPILLLRPCRPCRAVPPWAPPCPPLLPAVPPLLAAMPVSVGCGP